MKTTKTTINSQSSSVSTTPNAAVAASPRKKARKPPVAARVTASASAPVVRLPPATAPSIPTSPPAAAAGPVTPSAPATGASPAAEVDVGAPPALTLPAIPAGFVPANMADFRGYRPMASEVAAVADVIAELETFSNYDAVFGITAPPADQIAQRLAVATEWTSVLSQTSAWSIYVKSEEATAWKDALLLVERLKPAFQLAVGSNPALLGEYPALARLLGASKVVAKRATATKKKNAKDAATVAATPGGGSSTASPAIPANGGATTATAVPARIVTVQG